MTIQHSSYKREIHFLRTTSPIKKIMSKLNFNSLRRTTPSNTTPFLSCQIAQNRSKGVAFPWVIAFFLEGKQLQRFMRFLAKKGYTQGTPAIESRFIHCPQDGQWIRRCSSSSSFPPQQNTFTSKLKTSLFKLFGCQNHSPPRLPSKKTSF